VARVDEVITAIEQCRRHVRPPDLWRHRRDYDGHVRRVCRQQRLRVGAGRLSRAFFTAADMQSKRASTCWAALRLAPRPSPLSWPWEASNGSAVTGWSRQLRQPDGCSDQESTSGIPQAYHKRSPLNRRWNASRRATFTSVGGGPPVRPLPGTMPGRTRQSGIRLHVRQYSRVE
jgi:hypothetical protein